MNMHCQQLYQYQAEHQQHTTSSIYGSPFPSYSAPTYASGYPCSPPADRPSPTFRIEELLLQSKSGHFPTYTSPYSTGFSSASSGGHGYSHRVVHSLPHHQHDGLIGMPVPVRSCGASADKDYQGTDGFSIFRYSFVTVNLIFHYSHHTLGNSLLKILHAEFNYSIVY